MKNILKKNQVIITALVIMIAVAGYLNFTQNSTENIAGVDGDAVAVNAEQEDGKAEESALLEENEKAEAAELTLDEDGNEIVAVPKEDEILDLSAEDLGEDDEALAVEEASADTEDTTGEAVLVSNMIGRDFFASAKLTREQTRAKNKEMLMELVDNTSLTETQKQDAVDQVVEMTTIAEKEGSTEILLGAKGFEDVVVNMMDGGVDVIVNAKELTEQQMAQVEDIVKRKTGVAVENIVITPVGVEE